MKKVFLLKTLLCLSILFLSCESKTEKEYTVQEKGRKKIEIKIKTPYLKKGDIIHMKPDSTKVIFNEYYSDSSKIYYYRKDISDNTLVLSSDYKELFYETSN